MKTPFGFGLIGYGEIGTIHAEVARELEEKRTLKFLGIADPLFRECAGVSCYSDYRELLARDDVSAVAIATPSLTHYELARHALQSGKHVLLEKPPTLTKKESEDLIELARKNKLVLFMAFHARYSSAVQALRRIFVEEKFHVRRVAIDFSVPVLYGRDPQNWKFRRAEGGGLLMDSGINPVSVLTFLFPDASLRVASSTLVTLPQGTSEMKVDVYFTCGSAEGKLAMDGMPHGEPNIGISIDTREGHSFLVDIIHNSLLRGGVVVEKESAAVGDADWARNLHLREYGGVYRDFVEHLGRGISLVSTKELKFVLDAYRKAV